MKKWVLIAIFGLVMLASGSLIYRALAVNANPTPGSVWTWLGPTFGADWVSAPATVGGGGACTSIAFYGGVGDDATDNTAPLTAALAGSRCVVFPAGIFRFNGAVSFAFASHNQGVTIAGQGQETTVLHFPNPVNNALSFTKNQFDQSLHIRDLTITTGTHNIDTAIYVNNTWPGIPGITLQVGFAPNDITRVTLRSDEGYTTGGPGAPTTITKSWKNGIYLIQDSVWNLNEILMYGPSPPTGDGTDISNYPVTGGGAGYGIVLEGDSNRIIPVIFNIDRSNFQWVEIGVLILNWVQGVNVSQSNFTGNYIGVAVWEGLIGIAQLTVTGSQFNNAVDIWTKSRLQLFMVSNSIFYVPYSGYGIIYERAPFESTVITGNSFTGLSYNGGIGIVFDPIKGGTDMAPIVNGNGFAFMLYGLDLRGELSGLTASGNLFQNGHGANIRNTTTSPATAPFNSIAGSGNSQYGGPIYASASGAVSNGGTPPAPRVTVNSTFGFVTGQVVLAGGFVGLTGLASNQFKTTSLVVIDDTHMDLIDLLWLPENSYVSGGSITSLPP